MVQSPLSLHPCTLPIVHFCFGHLFFHPCLAIDRSLWKFGNHPNPKLKGYWEAVYVTNMLIIFLHPLLSKCKQISSRTVPPTSLHFVRVQCQGPICHEPPKHKSLPRSVDKEKFPSFRLLSIPPTPFCYLSFQ